jgi:hypothetical protein
MTLTEQEQKKPQIRPTIRQWELVCYAEEFWSEHKAFPSYAEIKKNVDGLSSNDEVESELYSEVVRSMLKNRGVDYSVTLKKEDPDYIHPSRLSDKQLAVISTLLNPLDTRSQSKKLADLGVKPVTFAGWMRGQRFSEYFKARSEELFGDALPLAHEALMRKVTDGDIRAIKLFYEVSGRYTGTRKEEVTNLRLLLVRVTEIMQRYLDPNTMRQVIDELNTLMLTSGVPNHNPEPAALPTVAERIHNG